MCFERVMQYSSFAALPLYQVLKILPLLFVFLFFCFCTVFGFNQTEFRGLERGERYAVEVGFLQGRPSALVIATLTLNFGTAGNFIYNFYVLMSLTVF